MTAPLWCLELAEWFWSQAGPPPSFPRDLENFVSALPFSVIDLPNLSVAGIRGWFERNGLAVSVTERDRPLRACLVAWGGHGFAFLDAQDEPAERSFSLAHELAHFLRDHLRPRERVAGRLGGAAREVLDGRRPATPEERWNAVLRNVPLGAFTHLLGRDDSGRPLTPAERESEAAADRLAFELLAPAGAIGDVTGRTELVERLVRQFGLPATAAATYAAALLPEPPRRDPALARLIRR